MDSRRFAISKSIREFVQLAIDKQWVNSIDRIYTVNRLIHILQVESYEESSQAVVPRWDKLVNYLDLFVQYAINKNLINSHLTYQREQLIGDIMNLITPLPSKINDIFWTYYEEMPEKATDYFYKLSQENDYIKTKNIQKNIHYTFTSPYGELEITINLSKPEKTLEEINLASQTKSVDYPQCPLCLENEGYEGSPTQAARRQHRVIRLPLNQSIYGFQYSPYVYYNEHSIFFSEEHRPMRIDLKCFYNLFSILDIFPHYFVGSNADLPGVGGSILSHDHYQGGCHQFPMDRAKVYNTFEFPNYSEVAGELIEWPMSVIRLRSKNKHSLIKLADHIHRAWRGYSDEIREIYAYTGNTSHNTITPIARKVDDEYKIDIVLRNNRQSKEYPEGIFHPHRDVQHIKKENIGLIEVLGLAILPGRLVEELTQIKAFLQDDCTIDKVHEVHHTWAQSLKQQIQPEEDLDARLKEEVGRKFTRILEDAGVFKWSEDGRRGLLQFIQYVQRNIKEKD